MNQILSTKLDKTCPKNRQKASIVPVPDYAKRHNWFQFQFGFSVLVTLFLVAGGVFYFYRLQRQEKFSTQLISNYNISRLYRKQDAVNGMDNATRADNENGLFRYYTNS